MKNSNLLLLLTSLVILIFFSSYSLIITPGNSVNEEISMPEDVKLVLDNKCFGCHNIESKADKAKEKLLLDKLSELDKVKLIASLSGIEEVIIEATMPPEKFLEKYPDKALTDEEAILIKEWAVVSAEKLLE